MFSGFDVAGIGLERPQIMKSPNMAAALLLLILTIDVKAEPAGSFQGNFIMHGIRSKTQRHSYTLSQKIRLSLFTHSLKRLILSSEKAISDQGKPLLVQRSILT